MKEDTEAMSSYALQPHAQQGTRPDGVTVVGEAVRRVPPDTLELLIEITTGATTAAQATRDNQTRTASVTQTVATMGVQAADLQTISQTIYNLYSPIAGGGPLLLGQGYPQMPMQQMPLQQMQLQPDIQFGSYQVRNVVRLNVREPNRAGEIVDAVSRAGATIIGGFSFKASDEAAARRSALEAAGKDAKSKAEALATATGKRVGDAVSISEEIVATNGAYTAMRTALPFAFGAGAPPVIGELEYYARVTANFRLQ
jgi:uncharacterized protein